MSEALPPPPSVQNVILPSVQQQVATSMLGWLVQQDRLAVWSMLTSGAMACGGAYALFWIAPQQLAEIRKGYDRYEESHVAEREESEKRHQQHVLDVVKKFEDVARGQAEVARVQSELIDRLILRIQKNEAAK